MATVAKGTEKPSRGSNISPVTMEFLMKGQVLGGKRIVWYLLPWKPNLLPWQPKTESCGSIRNFKAQAMRISVPVQCWFGEG